MANGGLPQQNPPGQVSPTQSDRVDTHDHYSVVMYDTKPSRGCAWVTS